MKIFIACLFLSLLLQCSCQYMVDSPAYNKRIEQEQSKELINRETQEINGDQTEFFVVVEQMPVLIGGMGNLQKQVKYPETARQAGIEGRVIVQFIVSETGSVINPKVIRGIGGGCDEAAIEAVKKVTFEPGSQRGVPVPVQFSLPIVFRL
jgi:protein TonB